MTHEAHIISITQFENNTLARASVENIYISTQKFDLYAGNKHYPYISMTVFYAVVEILFLQYQLYKQLHEKR